MATRPDWDPFFFSNGYETGTRIGDSPGCTNGCGDGTFDGCSTGDSKQCPGSGGDWCCDCNGCKPGKCDEKSVNDWCQNWYDTYGNIAAGCPPPNTDPCYKVDPLTKRLVANTDRCNCPGFSMPAGHYCNPTTGLPEPGTYGDPSPEKEPDTDDGPGSRPDTPNGTEVICYLKSVEVFGDYEWHRVPCFCRALGSAYLIRQCIFGTPEGPGIVDCMCGSIQINEGPIEVKCGETIDGKYTGEPCDPVECNCHSDCDPGQTCNEFGECV